MRDRDVSGHSSLSEYGDGCRTALPWDSLDEGTKWDTFFLAGGSIDDPKFWKPIIRAVEAGEIEVSETKQHCQGDAAAASESQRM